MPLLDVFPCEVTVAGRTLENVRILESAGRVLVIDYDGRAPRVAAEAKLAAPVDERRQLTKLETEAGVWPARKLGSCGCGHPLRRYSRYGLLRAAGVAGE